MHLAFIGEGSALSWSLTAMLTGMGRQGQRERKGGIECHLSPFQPPGAGRRQGHVCPRTGSEKEGMTSPSGHGRLSGQEDCTYDSLQLQ
jgi:hypothetical protein